MRNRVLVAVICVLVALGYLLGAGRVSLAKQPASAPEPGGSATSHQPADPGEVSTPTSESGEAPAARREPAQPKHAEPEPAQPEPARQDPVDRGSPPPQSDQRPTRQEPTHQQPDRQRPVSRDPAGASNAAACTLALLRLRSCDWKLRYRVWIL